VITQGASSQQSSSFEEQHELRLSADVSIKQSGQHEQTPLTLRARKEITVIARIEYLNHLRIIGCKYNEILIQKQIKYLNVFALMQQMFGY